MYQLPIKRRSHQDTLSALFALLKLTNGRTKEVTPRQQPVSLKHDQFFSYCFYQQDQIQDLSILLSQYHSDTFMNHSSGHSSPKYHNTNTNNRFSFLLFFPNKSRNGLPDPVNLFLSDPKITMADVKNIWALPPAAGEGMTSEIWKQPTFFCM